MVFNHYAKLKRILDEQPPGWFIVRINKPTTAKSFKNEVREFPYYYRLYDAQKAPITYGKFQQIERLAQILQVPIESLPVIDDTDL